MVAKDDEMVRNTIINALEEKRREDRKVAFLVGLVCGLVAILFWLLPGDSRKGEAISHGQAKDSVRAVAPVEPAAAPSPEMRAGEPSPTAKQELER